MNAKNIKTPTIEIDGHHWYQREGEPFGDYDTLTSYMGRKSNASTIGFVSRHNLDVLKHGRLSIVSKAQIDAASRLQRKFRK